MLVLGHVAVVGSVLIALLFVADATLDKNSSPVIVTSQRMGLPEPHYHSAIKTFTITQAPDYQTDLFVRQIFYQGLLAPDPLLPLDAQPGNLRRLAQSR